MSATAETVTETTTLIPAEFGDLQAVFTAPALDPMTERRRAVNREAVLALVNHAGLSPTSAVSVVTAIAKGRVPAVSITY